MMSNLAAEEVLKVALLAHLLSVTENLQRLNEKGSQPQNIIK